MNDVVSLDLQLHQKGASGKFEACVLKVSIKEEVKNKKAKTISSIELDLSDFVTFQTFETKVFNLLGKLKPPPSLRFRVKATSLKDGGKVASVDKVAHAVAVAPAPTPEKPIATLNDSDDSGEVKNPFGSAPKGYVGNALFKRTDGTYDAPTSLDATHAVLEQAKAVAVKEDTYTGNALFKQHDDDYKTPSRIAPSATMQLLEESKVAVAQQQTRKKDKEEVSNPFAARAPAVAVESPLAMGSPYGVMSPSSEELQLLRKQNKMLQETLEKQEAKIDQLRQKMHVRAAAKDSPPSPSLGGDAFLREKERALIEANARAVDMEKMCATQKVALTAERERCEQLSKSFAFENNRADELNEKLLAQNTQLESEKTDGESFKGSRSGKEEICGENGRK